MLDDLSRITLLDSLVTEEQWSGVLRGPPETVQKGRTNNAWNDQSDQHGALLAKFGSGKSEAENAAYLDKSCWK